MQLRYLYLFFLGLILAGCVKIIAGDRAADHSFDNRPVGASAQELLTDATYTSLVVEIQYMPGYAPSKASLAQVESFLEERLHKPGGIRIVQKEIPALPERQITREQVISLERRNRTLFTRDSELAVYLLFTNGEFTDPKILGWAYRNTSAVIYGKAIHDNSNKIGKPRRTRLETSIMLHEIGHLMGLVNVHFPMHSAHGDTARASHCENPKCLMYYGLETEDRFGHMLRRGVPQLDSA
ncbi:MAG TPA: hypothetical protein VHK69_04295, partial [Chitinophagaceae bacterium]|nr:hypothetical protein [Chitinophagaceae bacterium]